MMRNCCHDCGESHCDHVASLGELIELRHDLREAEYEIVRHHKDFGRIREALDTWNGNDHDIARVVRNIVG